jgi:hypothetical protein
MIQDTLEDTCHEGLVIRRTWSATDACGHETIIQQTIILNDHTPPEIQVPSYSVIHRFLDHDQNQIFYSQLALMDLLDALNENSVFVLDDCDEQIDVVFTVDTLFATNCEEQGYAQRRTYTWFATDVCGNTDSLTFTIDIMDDVPPVITPVPGDTMIICMPLPPVPVMLTEDSIQAMSIVFTEVIEPGSGHGEFDVIRTWVVTDSCNNSSTVIQHILWIPESQLECNIILPESVECNSHGVIIGSDVFGGFGLYTYEWQVVGEKCFIQAGQGTPEMTMYVGWSEVKIILTVTDTFGCITMCMITLNCTDPVETLSAAPSDFSPENSAANHQVPFQTVWTKNVADQIQNLNSWPNPVNESLYLSFESSIDQTLSITLFNLLNQVVLQDEFHANRGYNVHPMDMAHLPIGSYLMTVTSEQEMHTKVVVILRDK